MGINNNKNLDIYDNDANKDTLLLWNTLLFFLSDPIWT